MVSQDAALLPHLTVSQNLCLGLRLRGVSADLADRTAASIAETLDLRRLLTRLPQELSGGERRRVALGRALVRKPKVFLFDEPTASLDAPARSEMRALLLRLHRELRTTMIYVTHDQQEAMSLGQRVAVLRDGALQQVSDPRTLYRAPANVFVASFIGSPPMNLFRGHVARRGDQFVFSEHNVIRTGPRDRLEVTLGEERGARFAAFADGNVILGLRAEHIRVTEEEHCHLKAELEVTEYLGADALLHCTTGATRFRLRVPAKRLYRSGERIPVSFDLAQAVFFNPVSEKVIAL
jgi:multiple sugar transport system ATP-binding protein